jgi:hypothetical protein
LGKYGIIFIENKKRNGRYSMSTRGMHYNIMHKGYDMPLLWDGKIIDFDSEVQAQQFALAAGVDLKIEADVVFQEFAFEGRISGNDAFRELNKKLYKEG